MTAQPANLPAGIGPIRRSAAWWVWMGGQMLTLGVFAQRVPLAAGFPSPMEDSAGAGVAAVQLVLLILLAPTLLRGWRDALTVITAGSPVLLAAMLLSGAAARQAMLPIALLAAWSVALIAVRRTPDLHAAISLLAVAGPLVYYAASESPAGIHLSWLAAIFPAIAATSTAVAAASPGYPFVMPALIALLTYMAARRPPSKSQA